MKCSRPHVNVCYWLISHHSMYFTCLSVHWGSIWFSWIILSPTFIRSSVALVHGPLWISLFDYRLVQFIDSYDPPLKGLQEDLNFVSPRIGEVNLMLHFMNMILNSSLSSVLNLYGKWQHYGTLNPGIFWEESYDRW